ncbi:MAG: hypothetical protein JWO12_811 [Frankiales bacterium]|jgi:hypothetical protein|nr:hypothetical protein [Frankiales bacterium]
MLCHGELVVVETEDELHLGMAEVLGDVLVLRSGYVGRPLLVPLEEVESVVPASTHPDVDETYPFVP